MGDFRVEVKTMHHRILKLAGLAVPGNETGSLWYRRCLYSRTSFSINPFLSLQGLLVNETIETTVYVFIEPREKNGTHRSAREREKEEDDPFLSPLQK